MEKMLPRFVKLLQLLIAILVGGYVGLQMFLHGFDIFTTTGDNGNWFATLTVVLTLLLELALLVIYKLIEDD